jgi:hypothetical protein
VNGVSMILARSSDLTSAGALGSMRSEVSL